MNRHYILRVFREPLFHFLVLGAGLFILYAAVNGSADMSLKRIAVDEQQAIRLAEQFQRTWMRPPTRKELDGLVEEFVKEEVLYREALSLGLDQDDLVVRRRLRQKMEFINTDLVAQQVPTETDLQAYFDANKESFRRPDRFSFRQVYLNPRKSARDVKRTAAELLVRLNSDPALGAGSASMGDATLLPAELSGATPGEIANVFGRGFAADVAKVAMGRWSGPIESGYGFHLVRLEAHEAATMPTLEETRSIVEREWLAEHRKTANESFYQALRQRYDVEIRLPIDSADQILAVRRP